MSETNDVIKLLPDSVANQIAAGEVIQRPASVIKELVENAVDAGAKRVEIVIKDAGKTLIQIIDDGCGMSPTDARMAFERHATSKIRKADDLFTLHTMGFRGEALPSVAAVSEIDLRTMREADTIGTRLVIKASKVESQEPEVCAKGTNIMVKNLFYNFVARRRFLKKDSVELSHIMHEFERLALVNTEVEFRLVNNGTVAHQLPRGPLKMRIGSLFGKTVEKQLIPIDTRTALVRISGFIGLPSAARHRNALQFFFVNGRNMQHPYFRKAVLNCYKDLIAADVQPNYFINFEVAPERIDVNIHPQKHEIKFEDEQMIWQVLTAAVKESLGKSNVAPGMDFDAVDVPDIPPLVQGAAPTEVPPADELDPEYNPFDLRPFYEPPTQPRMFEATEGTLRHERRSALNHTNWEKLYENFRTAAPPSSTLTTVAPARTDVTEPVPEAGHETCDLMGGMPAETMADNAAPMFQLKNRWIVTSSKSGLMLIDQHRAHVRVLYERYLPTVRAGAMTSQRLIFAETVRLDAAQHAAMPGLLPVLKELGFDVRKAEGETYDADETEMTWILEAAPAEAAGKDAVQSLLFLISDLTETGADPGDEQRARVALAMARAAAVRNNQPLTTDEQQRLVSELFRLASPNYTPDGQIIIHTLTAEQIATYFHR